MFYRSLFLFFLFFSFRARANLELSLENFSYITATDFESQLDSYTNIGLNFTHFGFQNHWFYGGEFLASFAVDDSRQNYLSIPDLFVGYEFVDIFSSYQLNFVFGRQKRSSNIYPQKRESEAFVNIYPHPWSFLDEKWELGLWQGRMNWDYFLTEPTGLSGFFLTLGKDLWTLTFYLSGIFFPDQSPSIDITPKGEIYSSSRWFTPPQDELVIFNRRVETFYWLKKPYLKNVILNDSVAFRFLFGDIKDQWFNLSYAYKPVNQTYFKIDGNLSIDDDKSSVANSIRYESFKHSLLSIDFGLENDFFTGVASIVQEHPIPPKVSENWIIPSLPDAFFFSTYVKLDLKELSIPIDTIELNYLYSRFVEPKKSVSDTLKQLEKTFKAKRFKLNHGLSLSIHSSPLQFKKDQFISARLSYWYSIPDQGAWLNASLRWRFHTHFVLESQLDIIGANKSTPVSFFNTYRQNDRVGMKVIYEIP